MSHHSEIVLKNVVVLVAILDEIAVRQVIVQHVVLQCCLMRAMHGDTSIEGSVQGTADDLGSGVQSCQVEVERVAPHLKRLPHPMELDIRVLRLVCVHQVRTEALAACRPGAILEIAPSDLNVPRQQADLGPNLSLLAKLRMLMAMLRRQVRVQLLSEMPEDEWAIQRHNRSINGLHIALFHLTVISAVQAAISHNLVTGCDDDHVPWFPINRPPQLDLGAAWRCCGLQLCPSHRKRLAMHLNITSRLKQCLRTTERKLQAVPVPMQSDHTLPGVRLIVRPDEKRTSVDDNRLSLHVDIFLLVPYHVAFDDPEADVHVHVQHCRLALRDVDNVGCVACRRALAIPARG
mmetsp:Transcript_53249/g.134557  ORF Transcript_53249/g.134557 Transcript_53249/m.134557 type:complete len:348 (+) Transcript_53249:160-1203(+)